MQDALRGLFDCVRVQQGRWRIRAQAAGAAAAAAGPAVIAVLALAVFGRAAACGKGLGLGVMGMRVILGRRRRIGLAHGAGLGRMRHAATGPRRSRDALHRERQGQQA